MAPQEKNWPSGIIFYGTFWRVGDKKAVLFKGVTPIPRGGGGENVSETLQIRIDYADLVLINKYV